MSNALVLLQLLLQYAGKFQEVAALLAKATAEGRDVTDDEVASSTVARDAALAKTQATIDG